VAYCTNGYTTGYTSQNGRKLCMKGLAMTERTFEEEVEFRRTHSELEWSDYSLTGRDRMLGARMVAPSGFPMFRAWEISSCDTRGSSSTEEA